MVADGEYAGPIVDDFEQLAAVAAGDDGGDQLLFDAMADVAERAHFRGSAWIPKRAETSCGT